MSYKLATVASIEEVIKSGDGWQLVKVKTEHGEATGLNLKENRPCLLHYNDQYKNWNATPLSHWQYALFDILLNGNLDVEEPKKPEEAVDSEEAVDKETIDDEAFDDIPF